MVHTIKMLSNLIHLAAECQGCVDQIKTAKDDSLYNFWANKYNANLKDLKTEFKDLQEYLKVFCNIKTK